MSRYIDAEKLKEHASHYVRTQPHFHYGDWDNMCISGKEVDEIIDTCPTADVVEVRHAHWIDKSRNINGLHDPRFDCSVCGHIFWFQGAETFNYCPACGAKMDKERSENGD